LIKISDDDINSLIIKLNEITSDVKARFKDIKKFENVLIYGEAFSSSDNSLNQEPEEFTKKYLIDPLLNLLGWSQSKSIRLPTLEGLKKPDYIIEPKEDNFKDNFTLLVEAEPLNIGLDVKNHGLDQVRSWLLSKKAPDYGLATNGFIWVLARLNDATSKIEPIHRVDLRPAFIQAYNPKLALEIPREDITDILSDFLFLTGKNIRTTVGELIKFVEEKKEKISKSFYSDYVRFVFGFSQIKLAISGKSLLSSIITPAEAREGDERLFAVVLMNRLLFIKFLEERQLIPSGFLKKLFEKYQSYNPPKNFYDVYLKPLFYEVLNKERDRREHAVLKEPLFGEIPYLNGGLFRTRVIKEKDFDVEDDGIELILKEIIEKYSFSGEEGLDPDILGYVFEKTINYISGSGSNEQKLKGAYYTPDDVVQFIIENTLSPIILKKFKQGLTNAGYLEGDIRRYKSLDDVFEFPPMHRGVIKEVINSLNSIKVLDPACGSGHFLTTVLAEILRVEELLLKNAGEDVDRYSLKSDIISKNIFGVDFDENATEIARLRLWLALIEDVTKDEHIKTLPNIDFNILVGNSLVGWLDERFESPLLITPVSTYFGEFADQLANRYPEDVAEIKSLLEKGRMEPTLVAYNKLVKIYTAESGICAEDLQDLLERFREELYKQIKAFYLNFISEKGSISKAKLKQIRETIDSRVPFHWLIDFEDIIKNGGFDAIIGNPPYILDQINNNIDTTIVKTTISSREVNDKPLFYDCKDCGNTYAYFTERSLKLLKKGGRFGFIVPLSIVATDDMKAVREFVQRNCCKISYYNFDDRPGKLFPELEHCRSSIVITEKGESTDSILTSKYHRWYTRDRSTLFKNLKTTLVKIVNGSDPIPKIGTEIEKSILSKLSLASGANTVGDQLLADGVNVWYHNAPQYWIHAHSDAYVPKSEYRSAEGCDIKVPDHYKSVVVSDADANIALGLLNSSLFYWWWIVWSNCRDLLLQQIKEFFFDFSRVSPDLESEILPLVTELMDDYEHNSAKTTNRRSGGYEVTYSKYQPGESKYNIDKIDKIFAGYFSFTNEEADYLINFDIEFRTARLVNDQGS
jgi:hypothetical protein